MRTTLQTWTDHLATMRRLAEAVAVPVAPDYPEYLTGVRALAREIQNDLTVSGLLIECPDCQGVGEIATQYNGYDNSWDTTTCGTCEGFGSTAQTIIDAARDRDDAAADAAAERAYDARLWEADQDRERAAYEAATAPSGTWGL